MNQAPLPLAERRLAAAGPLVSWAWAGKPQPCPGWEALAAVLAGTPSRARRGPAPPDGGGEAMAPPAPPEQPTSAGQAPPKAARRRAMARPGAQARRERAGAQARGEQPAVAARTPVLGDAVAGTPQPRWEQAARRRAMARPGARARGELPAGAARRPGVGVAVAGSPRPRG
ncbi:MAG: hypothetical protein LBD77_09095, partial [Bifidobacteriaceae bacterium]|nr:hypothetical protein [Bifidobacteriaceae bacterium]